MFNVTYSIVSQESAEHGEACETGLISEGVGLREAIDGVTGTRTSHVTSVHAVEFDGSHPPFRWITVTNGIEYLTGDTEERTLHMPEGITEASARRIMRLILA